MDGQLQSVVLCAVVILLERFVLIIVDETDICCRGEEVQLVVMDDIVSESAGLNLIFDLVGEWRGRRGCACIDLMRDGSGCNDGGVRILCLQLMLRSPFLTSDEEGS